MESRIVRCSEIQYDTASKYFGSEVFHLHKIEDIPHSRITADLFRIYPGGGHEYRKHSSEQICYVLWGQITIRTQLGQTVLRKGDSVHCGANQLIGILNESSQPCELLVFYCRS